MCSSGSSNRGDCYSCMRTCSSWGRVLCQWRSYWGLGRTNGRSNIRDDSMIFIDFLYKALALLGGVFILGMFAWIYLCLRLAYTRMDEILDLLKNCTAIMNRAPLRHGGALGKLLLIGGISGIVAFPGFYLKHGGVSVEDLNGLPMSLRKKFVFLQLSVICLIVGACICAAGIKLIKLYTG